MSVVHDVAVLFSSSFVFDRPADWIVVGRSLVRRRASSATHARSRFHIAFARCSKRFHKVKDKTGVFTVIPNLTSDSFRETTLVMMFHSQHMGRFKLSPPAPFVGSRFRSHPI